MNRRRFIKQSAACSAAGLLFSSEIMGQKKLIDKIGIQFFSLPKLLEKDFAATLGMLSQMGYKEVEWSLSFQSGLREKNLGINYALAWL